VYKAEKDGVEWAVKKFNPCSLMCRDVAGHCAEIDICLHLSSPYLVKGKEYFYRSEDYYLVMELAECDLETYVTREQSLSADLLIPQLLLCLQSLQENNLSHGDIKATNFVVKEDKILLTDFGLSRSQDVTIRNTYQTPGFDSPQNIVANYNVREKEINAHCDIFMEEPDGFDSVGDVWALGVTIVYVLVGKFLFSSQSTEGYLRLVEEYISSPETYLFKIGIDKMWFPLLLRMLCPSYKNRVKRISDLTTVKLRADETFYTRINPSPPVSKTFTRTMKWAKEVFAFFSLTDDTIRESKLLYQHCYRVKNMQLVEDEKEHLMLFGSCLTIVNSVQQNKPIFEMDVVYIAGHVFEEVEFVMYQNKLFDDLQARVTCLQIE
jgi:serine/threonine protein kinase